MERAFGEAGYAGNSKYEANEGESEVACSCKYFGGAHLGSGFLRFPGALGPLAVRAPVRWLTLVVHKVPRTSRRPCYLCLALKGGAATELGPVALGHS